MEVRNACVACLSNYEVLNILQGAKSNKKQRKPTNRLATITYQTIRYLEDSPCKRQTPEKIMDFLKAAETFKLTKCEKLTVLNLCPKTALEIQLLVESIKNEIPDPTVIRLSVRHGIADPIRQGTGVNCSIVIQAIEDSEERLSEEEVESLLRVITCRLPEDVPNEEIDPEYDTVQNL